MQRDSDIKSQCEQKRQSNMSDPSNKSSLGRGRFGYVRQQPAKVQQNVASSSNSKITPPKSKIPTRKYNDLQTIASSSKRCPLAAPDKNIPISIVGTIKKPSAIIAAARSSKIPSSSIIQPIKACSKRQSTPCSSKIVSNRQSKQMVSVKSTVCNHNSICPARQSVLGYMRANAFEEMVKRLRILQTEFLLKYEFMKTTLPQKLEGEYKLMTFTKDEQCKLILAYCNDLVIPKSLPVQMFNVLKKNIHRCMEMYAKRLMNTLCKSKEDSHDAIMQNLITSWETDQVDILEEIFTCLVDICKFSKTEENHEYKDENSTISQMEESTKCGSAMKGKKSELAKLQPEVSGNVKTVDTSKQEYSGESNQLAKFSYKKAVASHIVEETKSAFLKKIHNLELEIATIKNERSILADQITELQLNYDKEMCEQKTEHESSMKMLKEYLKGVQIEKEEHEQKNRIMLENNVDLSKRLEDSLRAISKYEEMKHNYEKWYKIITEVKNLAETDGTLAEDDIPKYLEEMINALKTSNQAQSEEILLLKQNLSNANSEISLLEKHLKKENAASKIRSTLIKTLEAQGESNRQNFEELQSEVCTKTNTISQLNNEINIRQEEFQNLFTTLGSKQMELTRQQHMIKLLEESNSRSQMLRIKQEEKIAKMDAEINHLRHAVQAYQNSLLRGTRMSQPNSEEEPSSESHLMRENEKIRA